MRFTLSHVLIDHEVSDTSVKAIVVMHMVISLSLLSFESMRVYYLDKAKSDRKVCTADYVELNV
jgi:hypothetical protein